jgi:hypothetical protein
MEQLQQFKSLLEIEIDPDSIESHFDELANYLMNKLYLKAGGNSYRIVEIEFYYVDEKKHNDIFCHRNSEQLKSGTWYFNGFGLDLTFGNSTNNVFGGILIRGIRSIDAAGQYFSGPSTLLKELFSSLGSATNQNNGFYLTPLASNIFETEHPVKSVRINLPKNKIDEGDFFNKKYRYIVEINPNHKFAQKSSVFNELVSIGQNKISDAKEILGYNIKSKLI